MQKDQADLFLTSCTNAVLAVAEPPELQVVQIPDTLNVGAAYGLIELSDSEEARRLIDRDGVFAAAPCLPSACSAHREQQRQPARCSEKTRPGARGVRDGTGRESREITNRARSCAVPSARSGLRPGVTSIATRAPETAGCPGIGRALQRRCRNLWNHAGHARRFRRAPAIPPKVRPVRCAAMSLAQGQKFSENSTTRDMHRPGKQGRASA